MRSPILLARIVSTLTLLYASTIPSFAQVIPDGRIRFETQLVYAAIDNMGATVLEAEDFDAFGHALVLDGDELVASAPLRDGLAGLDIGRVYIYQGGGAGNSWMPDLPFNPPSPEQGQQFGGLAKDGDVIVVSSRREDAIGVDSGALHEFRRVAGTWNYFAGPTPSGLVAGDRLSEVAYQADIGGGIELLVVGAPQASVVGLTRAGKVWIFERSGAGSWAEVATLLQPGGSQEGALFGRAAVDGNRIAVSAEFAQLVVTGLTDPIPEVGAVFVFERGAGGAWTLEDTVRPDFFGASSVVPIESYVFEDSRFGVALDLEGTTLVVGAPRDDVEFVPSGPFQPPLTGDEGAVYVYKLSGANNWILDDKLMASDGHDFDHFGQAVALDGNMLVAGAPGDDDASPDAGSVYVWERTSSSQPFTESVKLRSCVTGQHFGSSVALSEVGSIRRIAASAPFVPVPPLFTPPSPGESQPIAGMVTVFEENTASSPTFRPFCFGDGGYRVGNAEISCAPCPCGNEAPLGSAGGCLNEDGLSGILSGMGVPSATNDTMVITTSNLIPNSFGLLLSAPAQLPGGVVPCPCGSGVNPGVGSPSGLGGLRCIGGGLTRHGTRATGVSGGSASWNNLINPSGWTAGITRFFQVFYRDDGQVGSNPCNTLSTTQGLGVVILP